MTGKFRHWLPILLSMQAVSGCSTIKGWFPDKERDYQFRAEIPELIVPDDLKAKTLPNLNQTSHTPEQIAAAAVAERDVEPAAANQSQSNTPATEPKNEAASEDKPTVQVIASNAAVSSLQIDQPQKQAWRLVSRALSRERLEIVERNIDKGYFFVKFDPAAIKAEDNTIWDEVNFVFGEDPSHEQEYRISLQEVSPQVSEVTVQDSDNKTLSNATATALLKLITEGIKQDLGTDAPEPEKQPAP